MMQSAPPTDWFDGIAKIIVAFGSLGGMLAAVFAWVEARSTRIAGAKAAKEAAVTLAAQDKIMHEQTGTLARVEGNTDGALSESKETNRILGKRADTLAIEIERIDDGGEPTPKGTPTAGKVGMVDGRATTHEGPTTPSTEEREP